MAGLGRIVGIRAAEGALGSYTGLTMTSPTPTSASDLSRGSEAVTSVEGGAFRVVVTPTYEPDHSDAAEGRYVFTYRIRITNESEEAAVLLSRRWVIVDADGERHEVEGDGVVGRQPRIEPGSYHEYESFCPLQTPWGTMEGHYRMGLDDGRRFEVEVARFYLAAPQG